MIWVLLQSESSWQLRLLVVYIRRHVSCLNDYQCVQMLSDSQTREYSIPRVRLSYPLSK